MLFAKWKLKNSQEICIKFKNWNSASKIFYEKNQLPVLMKSLVKWIELIYNFIFNFL